MVVPIVTGGNKHDHSGGDGAQIDHGGLAGLLDDDHTQYLLRSELGSGGGVDADTVDSLEASQFLRSDASDTTSGNISIVKGTPVLTLNNTTTGSGNWPRIDFDEYNHQGVTLRHVEFDGELCEAGYGMIFEPSADNPGGSTLQFIVLGKIFAGATTVGGCSEVWHGGNDGTGSGLDADLLDGNEASVFMLKDGEVISDWDTYYSGDFMVGSGSTNSPSPGTNYIGAWFPHSGGGTYGLQIAARNDIFYVRTREAGSWGSWRKLWYDGNDGAGSGLDADTLDGNEATDFVALSTLGADLQDPNSGALSAGSWYTIAANAGNRAQAQFVIWNETGGKHQSVTIMASHMYGANSTIQVLDNCWYSGYPIQYIRIMEGGTYDGAMLQIYASSAMAAGSCGVQMIGNKVSAGWVLKDFVISTSDPGTVATYSALTNQAATVDLTSVGGQTTFLKDSSGNLVSKSDVDNKLALLTYLTAWADSSTYCNARITGTHSSYAGFEFASVNANLMLSSTLTGFWRPSGGWQFRYNSSTSKFEIGSSYYEAYHTGNLTPSVDVVLSTDRTTTSTTLANVTGLSFSVDASSTYVIEGWIVYDVSTAALGALFSATGPASTSIMSGLVMHNTTGAASGTQSSAWYANDGGVTTTGSVSTAGNIAHIKAVIKTGGTSGTWQLRYAMETAGAYSLTVKAGSTITYRKVA